MNIRVGSCHFFCMDVFSEISVFPTHFSRLLSVTRPKQKTWVIDSKVQPLLSYHQHPSLTLQANMKSETYCRMKLFLGTWMRSLEKRQANKHTVEESYVMFHMQRDRFPKEITECIIEKKIFCTCTSAFQRDILKNHPTYLFPRKLQQYNHWVEQVFSYELLFFHIDITIGCVYLMPS